MTVMTPEYKAILKKERRDRYNAARKFIGAQTGDGKHLRYQGPFCIGEGEACHVFRYWEEAWNDAKTGRNHYVLVNIDTMEARWDKDDEWLRIMMQEYPMLYID